MRNPINYGRAFAIAQMSICIWCAIAYALQKDWRRALYWTFAAGITATVTF